MKQLNKYLLVLVCILAVGSLTGCGRRNNETEQMTEGTTATTERNTVGTTETERITDRNTERDTERITDGTTTDGTTTTETGMLEELGNDVREGVEDIGRGVENVGEDVLGTERATDNEDYMDGTETNVNK